MRPQPSPHHPAHNGGGEKVGGGPLCVYHCSHGCKSSRSARKDGLFWSMMLQSEANANGLPTRAWRVRGEHKDTDYEAIRKNGVLQMSADENSE